MKTLCLVLIICCVVLAKADHNSGFGYELIAGYLEAIQSDIQLMKNDVKAIQTKVNELKGDQDKLNGEFTGHKTAINSKVDQIMKGDLLVIRLKVDQLNYNQDKLNGGIADNIRIMNSTIHTKVDQLKKELTDNTMIINVKIDKLSTELINHKKTFDSTVDKFMDAITAESSCPKNGISGEFTIKPFYNPPISVFCDKGWITIQRRMNGGIWSFNRNWTEYRDGFGHLSANYWMGLERMHQITRAGSYELWVVVINKNDSQISAYYETFRIASEAEQYRLDLGNFIKGAAEDKLTYSSGSKFSTPDRDNDVSVDSHQAKNHECGWWYKEKSSGNLNGLTGTDEFWWNGRIKGSWMVIRAVK